MVLLLQALGPCQGSQIPVGALLLLLPTSPHPRQPQSPFSSLPQPLLCSAFLPAAHRMTFSRAWAHQPLLWFVPALGQSPLIPSRFLWVDSIKALGFVQNPELSVFSAAPRGSPAFPPQGWE